MNDSARTRAAHVGVAGRVRPYEGALETELLTRIRDHARAQNWAEFQFLERRPIPWNPPRSDLPAARVALVTTAGFHLRGDVRFAALERPRGDASVRVVPHGARPEQLDLEAPYLDAKYAVRDPEVGLPARALDRLVARGAVGSAAAHHYSLCGGILEPYPELALSVERIAQGLVIDEVDLVCLVPTCSVCVQTTALVASELEERGWTTVCLSLLPELSRIVGAPRTLTPHFPFGAPLGDPHHGELHEAVLLEALQLCAGASAAGDVVASRSRWRRDP